jgi:type II secretory pathway pseudopilin PulG
VRRSDDGVTLVELIVVLGLTSLAAVMMLGFLNQTMITSSSANSNAIAERDAQLALREITQDVRAATAIRTTGAPSTTACPSTPTTFPSAFPNCVSFAIPRSTSSSDTCSKSIVTYGLLNGTIRKDLVEVRPNAGSCTSPISTTKLTGKIVATNVKNTAAQPLFQYFDNYTNRITGTASTDLIKYQSARNVMVDIRMQANQSKTPLVFTSTVALRNNR